MRTKRMWKVCLVSIVLVSLIVPAAMALDVCGQGFLFIVSEPDPVNIDCETGYTIVSNSTVNLLPGAHISETYGGVGGGILSVDYGSTNTINIHGGQIDTMLNTASTDTVTVYGSAFAVDGNLVSGDQIVNTGGGTYIFTLTGLYEDGSSINLPCHLETGGTIFLDVPEPPTAPEIDVLPALLEWDFGDVAIGESTTQLIQIFNSGTADLTVSSVTLAGNADFAITSGPEAPIVIAPSLSVGVDFEITYTASVEGPVSAVVSIVSDDEDEPVVNVDLTGVGVVIDIPPSQQIQDILDLFDASVAEGSLLGYGPGNSASKRLKALRNMIESASDLIDAGDYAHAVDQLESVAKKTDDVAKPQDFVVGEATSTLNTMINELIADLAS